MAAFSGAELGVEVSVALKFIPNQRKQALGTILDPVERREYW